MRLAGFQYRDTSGKIRHSLWASSPEMRSPILCQGFPCLGFFSSGSYSGAGHTFVPRHGRPSEVSRISKVGHTQSPTAHVVNSLQLGNPLSKVYGL